MAERLNGIEGKVVVVTGASSGIGEATARLLARRGAEVILGARRTDRLEKLAGEIRSVGGTAEFRAHDVTKRDDVESIVRFAVETFGRLDVVVNNAGVMPLSNLDRLKVDEWTR
jgi:NADP-dependent 3-hydroxy acid dehydrogenase YdfG